MIQIAAGPEPLSWRGSKSRTRAAGRHSRVPRGATTIGRSMSTGAAALPSVMEACGPDIWTLRELVELAGRLTGHPRPVVPLPNALARLQAAMLELAPGEPMMSRDNRKRAPP